MGRVFTLFSEDTEKATSYTQDRRPQSTTETETVLIVPRNVLIAGLTKPVRTWYQQGKKVEARYNPVLPNNF
jgi:hypothetical protein